MGLKIREKLNEIKDVIQMWLFMKYYYPQLKEIIKYNLEEAFKTKEEKEKVSDTQNLRKSKK